MGSQASCPSVVLECDYCAYHYLNLCYLISQKITQIVSTKYLLSSLISSALLPLIIALQITSTACAVSLRTGGILLHFLGYMGYMMTQPWESSTPFAFNVEKVALGLRRCVAILSLIPPGIPEVVAAL